jgi:hypothetical protein
MKPGEAKNNRNFLCIKSIRVSLSLFLPYLFSDLLSSIAKHLSLWAKRLSILYNSCPMQTDFSDLRSFPSAPASEIPGVTGFVNVWLAKQGKSDDRGS